MQYQNADNFFVKFPNGDDHQRTLCCQKNEMRICGNQIECEGPALGWTTRGKLETSYRGRSSINVILLKVLRL